MRSCSCQPMERYQDVQANVCSMRDQIFAANVEIAFLRHRCDRLESTAYTPTKDLSVQPDSAWRGMHKEIDRKTITEDTITVMNERISATEKEIELITKRGKEQREETKTMLHNAVTNAVVASSKSLAQTVSERFTVVEVDLATVKASLESLTPGVDSQCVEQISAMESTVASLRSQMEYFERVSGHSLASEWQLGDRVYLKDMKSQDRNDKCGVIYSAPGTDDDRIAVLLHDEDAPIRVPRNNVAPQPWKFLFDSLEDKLDDLGKMILEEATCSKRT